MRSACHQPQLLPQEGAAAAERLAKPVRMRAGFQPWAPRGSRPASSAQPEVAAAAAAADQAMSGEACCQHVTPCSLC